MPLGSAKGLGWVDAIHPSDRQRVFETLALPIAAPSRSASVTPTVTRSREPESMPTDTEIRLKTNDGSHRWFLIRARVVSDAGGRPAKRFGTATDIDDLKQAERALRERMSELAHMNRRALASELSAAIAHELNQPLGAILSNTETAEVILNSPSPSVNDIKEILADIKRDDQRASEVIRRLRRLLTNSGVEAQEVDLNDIVCEAIELLSAQASERNVRLDRALTPQVLRISGDRIQLQQVILNLVVNGIEAVERAANGNRKVVVTSTALLDGATAEISVGDSGGGVGVDELERVFEPFFTTKEHGMGMGLSIARTIIEAHGGRIWVETETQGGALFRIKLPLAKGR
jgi:PAS domain S-box-containing protein